MDPMLEAIVKQRNAMATRCLDLELEIHARDRVIADLDAKVKKLEAPPETEDGLQDN